MKLAITYFKSLRDPVGQRVNTTWPALCGRLAKAAREVAVKDQTPGLSLATFAGERRSLANVEQVFGVGLDLDHLDAVSAFSVHDGPDDIIEAHTWDRLVDRFRGIESFIHTTWSSTTEALRARVFFLLSRPVTASEYRRVYAAIAARAEAAGLIVDRAASDPSRFWYLPSHPVGGSSRSAFGAGRPVNVDWALSVVPAPVSAPPPSATRFIPRANGGPIETAKAIARAEAYVEHCAPAVSGSGGSVDTFNLAMKIARGFDLDVETAFHVLWPWNLTCQPPWSEKDLRKKIRDADEKGTMPRGELRDRPLLRRAS